MCGILTLIDHDAPSATLCATHQHMAARLAHRGPDAAGVLAIPRSADQRLTQLERRNKSPGQTPPVTPPALFADAIGFVGHHRLAIIDPADHAHQPFVDGGERVALVLNGEIYNYVELRQELRARGYAFSTTSDTEVALLAYLEWADDCFARFNGDFAIVIVDQRRRVVVGARDRFGVKPLFCARRDAKLALASELKGLLDLPWLTATLNQDVAYRYLAADFPTAATLGESFLAGVQSIPAAHRFTYELDARRWHCAPYWDLAEEVARQSPPHNSREAVRTFDNLLADAVRLRLRSDVPLGAFLSGGLDSSTVVWHAQRFGGALPTFSAVFPGSDVDETPAIELLKRTWRLDNTAQSIDYGDLLAALDELVYLQDEPFTTLNVFSQYMNFKAAGRRNVKVLLDGGGADEYLAGYDDYAILAAADAARSGRRSSDDPRVLRLLALSNDELAAWAASHEHDRRVVPYLADGAWRGELDRPLDSAYKGEFEGSLLKHALWRSTTGAWMNKSVAWDNRYLDRNSMWCGIEARVPFQDHRLAAFVLSLPARWITDRGYSKLPLRRSMGGRLPGTLRANRRKVGFEFPFCQLLRESAPLRQYFTDLAASEEMAALELVSAAAVRDELQRIIEGVSNNYNLWRVFNLLLWQRHYTRTGTRTPTAVGATA